jgi:hypothetical protein
VDDHTIECSIFDFRKHIAFDTTQMEFPLKCDLCKQNATHFCMIHRGVYCRSHVSSHDGIPLDQFIISQDSSELVKKLSVLKDGISVFSEEDIDLVVQQTGVDREKARSTLIEAKGDLARAILLLTTG